MKKSIKIKFETFNMEGVVTSPKNQVKSGVIFAYLGKRM